MRKLWIAAVLAGCASSPDPHEVVACMGYTVNGAPATNQLRCEAPCGTATSGAVPDGSGSSCSGSDPDGPEKTYSCQSSLVWMNIRGCCAELGYGSGYGAFFFECQ